MEKIFLRIERDFSQIFGDGFRFLRQNFGPFYKALLYVVGPVLIMYAVVNGLMYNQLNAVIGGIMSDWLGGIAGVGSPSSPQDVEMFVLWLLILLATALVLNVFFMGTLVHFIRLYDERGVSAFTTDDVWKSVTRDFGYFFVTALGLIVVFLPIILALFAVFFVLALVPVLGIVLVVLACLALLLIFTPVLTQWAYSVYMVRCTERRPFFESVSRATRLVRSRFWSVWLVGFVILIISMVASFIIALPEGIVQFIAGVHSVTGGDSFASPSLLVVVLNSVTLVLTQLVMAIPYIFLGIQHYSLVERVDGSGMAEMIDEIGKPQSDAKGAY